LQDLELEETTPTIYCHALAGINTPQTLKIEGYIKKKKVIMLIDFGSTHNFINFKLAKLLNCFIYPTPEFQVMIADGGTINYLEKFHSINLTMGEYFYHMTPDLTGTHMHKSVRLSIWFKKY
jgi:hypothetical protein